ncbi:MAG: hypothetical protein Q8R37_01170 [Nanoarchaeota archaeon]|nr:hypothetical protein [Nanoarchaeota archaeon]
MTIHFNKTLPESLEKMNIKKYHTIPIHDSETLRTVQTSDEIIDRYGKAKWKIVDLLNGYYQQKVSTTFDLYNWLHKNKDDEVSYFLSEAGSNCLNYATFKAPSEFHLWLGENSFIIGIEQKGDSFPAQKIDQQWLKENDGAAFTFFRECKSKIFFNHPEKATIVYLECFVKNVHS